MAHFDGTHYQQTGQRQFEEGLALEAQGKTSEAIEAYRSAIRLNPRFAQAHFNLGVNLAVIGQNDQAVRAWKRAVWLNNDFRNDLILALDLQHELRECVI